MTSRFYKNEFPEVDDLVMVRVEEVGDISSTVILLEYGEIEGIILHSELSRKKFRSINNVIRVGNREIMQVTMVDPSKNYINLSKKNLKPEDHEIGGKKFVHHSMINSVIKFVANFNNILSNDNIQDVKNTLSMYEDVIWPLIEKHGDDLFERINKGDTQILDDVCIDENTKYLLIKTINHRLQTPPVKYQANVEVMNYGISGVEGIKKALQTALDEANSSFKGGMEDDSDLNRLFITLQASPEWLVYVTSDDENKALTILNKAIDTIDREIKLEGGKSIVKTTPRKI